MAKTDVLFKTFEKLSNTGSEVLILKAIKDCDCYDPNSLVNSEPDPHCQKCYGTGKEVLKILSEKIRSESERTGSGKSIENVNHIKTMEELKVFYFYDRYKFINNEDLICTLENGKVDRVYKIKAKDKLNCVDFAYYEVIGKKINHFINISDIYEK